MTSLLATHDLVELDASAAAAAVASASVSPLELLEAALECIDCIDAVDGAVHAWSFPDRAAARAGMATSTRVSWRRRKAGIVFSDVPFFDIDHPFDEWATPRR